ncbi:MAG: hypothetical protein ABSF83_03295 [Nitrososphaerales archaeon]|jgi:hypothetical protein
MQVPEEASEDFWESLEISIDDVVREHGRTRAQLYKWLGNKLSQQSRYWYSTICQTYRVMGDGLAEVVSRLDRDSPSDFRNLIGLAVFAGHNINQKIIFEECRSNLDREWIERIEKREIDSAAILLPLFQHDPKLLTRIYYEHLIESSSIEGHILNPQLGNELDFTRFTQDDVGALLSSYEESLDERSRRDTKLWWFTSDGNRMRIVFRREKKLSSMVKKVRRNEFLKGGDEKILIFREGGNRLDLASKRQPKTTLKIAEFIIKRVTNVEAIYEPIVNQLSVERFGKFIRSLRLGEIEGAVLVSFTARNAPLTGSPTMEVNCMDADVTPALSDLAQYGVDITNNPSDVQKFGVRVHSHTYTIRATIDDQTVSLSVDNRYLSEEDKARIGTFLAERVGHV